MIKYYCDGCDTPLPNYGKRKKPFWCEIKQRIDGEAHDKNIKCGWYDLCPMCERHLIAFYDPGNWPRPAKPKEDKTPSISNGNTMASQSAPVTPRQTTTFDKHTKI